MSDKQQGGSVAARCISCILSLKFQTGESMLRAVYRPLLPYRCTVGHSAHAMRRYDRCQSSATIFALLGVSPRTPDLLAGTS